MPSFNIYEDLIEPLGAYLQSAPELQDIPILFDDVPEEDEGMELGLVPGIKYFLLLPAEDIARGSGSSSPQLRRMEIGMGFGVFYAHTDRAELHRGLWGLTGTLLDLIRAKTNFNPRKGITLLESIPIDYAIQRGTTPLVGGVIVTARFGLFAGPFAGGPNW